MRKKSKPWYCLLTCFAELYDITENQLIDLVQHDGSEIICPDLDEPLNRRGFHSQELVVAGLAISKPTTMLIFDVVQVMGDGSRHAIPLLFRPARVVKEHRGVLCGANTKSGHAYYFEDGKFGDPDTGVWLPKVPENFQCTHLFIRTS